VIAEAIPLLHEISGQISGFGKWRLEGKEYIVKDGDVMHFRFNV